MFLHFLSTHSPSTPYGVSDEASLLMAEDERKVTASQLRNIKSKIYKQACNLPFHIASSRNSDTIGQTLRA